MSEFACELKQSLSEAVAFLDGKLACRVYEYVQRCEGRKAMGLSPEEMAERLGMNVGACLACEGRRVEVRKEWAYCEPPRKRSPEERLAEVVAVRTKGV